MKNSCVQWVAKELSIVFPYLFDSDLQYNLRQGWRHVLNGYCDHCCWKKLNNWLQCRSSLRCCHQSVHVYQNCLKQSKKHVCNCAYRPLQLYGDPALVVHTVCDSQHNWSITSVLYLITRHIQLDSFDRSVYCQCAVCNTTWQKFRKAFCLF